jgi:hypothetical protein
MKIDSALKNFSEKYDRSAIESIETLSQDLGLNSKPVKDVYIELFNIKEGFENFQEFLDGYSKYKIENINNEKASPHEIICEQVNGFIGKLFKETKASYSELPAFVESYITGIRNISTSVDVWKNSMMEAEVDTESISSINEFVDEFVDTLHESFDKSMDRILWASGYHTKNNLAKKESTVVKPVFL